MEIELSKGGVAIVDDDDYEWLSKYAWHPHQGGYAYRSHANGRNQTVLMHRAILQQHGVDLADVFVDHINRNKLDNRKCNLRTCNTRQNGQNRDKTCRNQSGYKGVDWVQKDGFWRAKIRANGKLLNIGYFDTALDAAIAYNHAAAEHFKAFAVFNDIPGWRELHPAKREKGTRLRKSNKSGFKNVNFHSSMNKWTARIYVAGKRLVLGYFDTPEAAAAAYQKAADEQKAAALRDAITEALKANESG